MHPDELLSRLLETAGTRKGKSLEAIHATCRQQHEHGSKDFSIPTIARLGRSRGGPVAGTIRNKTGDDYRAIIKAWANHAGGATRKLPKVAENPIMDLIKNIDDPAVRSVMAGVLAENRKLRGEINLLKSEISKSSYIDLREGRHAADRAVQILPALADLLPIEIDAVRYAISKDKLLDEGWVVDKDGRICTEEGRMVFPIGFTSALQKLVTDGDSKQKI